MTNEEEIKILDGIGIYSYKEYTAARMAIKAIEKQIPKKPVIEEYFYGEIRDCPSCGIELKPCNYCPKCGQAIDWK